VAKVAELPSPITGIISQVLGIARWSSGPGGNDTLLSAARRRGERPDVGREANKIAAIDHDRYEGVRRWERREDNFPRYNANSGSFR